MSDQVQYGVRLLSFDGGGIRGLSSLLILKEVMARIQRIEGLSEPPLPWRYFDMITGTSTGGLIAIMLGRLRMSVDEAIACYTLLSERIFSETKHKWQDGRFKTSNLERTIKQIVHDHTADRDEDTRMSDLRPDGASCRVFVCAMSADNMNARIPVRFRTYNGYQNQMPNCRIWEAARATSAAPTFFKQISIEDFGLKTTFVDGGMGCNNPTAQLLNEARYMFPGRYLSCLISIGTGHSRTIAIPKPGLFQNIIPKDVIKALQRISTDCEATAEDIASRFADHPSVYFRFNVDQGMQGIGLGDWERLGQVSAHTRAYLSMHENNKRVNEAVAAIRAKRTAVPIVTVSR
ncbi:patatin-like phospholipase protein [Ceratobasidium sp. AG-Ba]|nr:patatin-like phospholipase protein [Ceratobasidium sp. AG-Ba]QRW02605.1 patatin-like phospholipase protein [Ceratobasidium sp. AG-Ba]